jgi:phosphonate transport system substrate-binding protein
VIRRLRFATFLAPNMFPVYAFITRYVGEQLGCHTELFVGSCYEEFATTADAGFICGLPYVELRRREPPFIEPLAAPILKGRRYQGKPIYYSDVIVRRDSPFQSFADLRGCSWSYNEPSSQSGYGVTRYHLACMGETASYFGKIVEAGFHEQSIQLVRAGHVDASAIDSQVLAVALRDEPELASQVKVIDSLGPSTIQPFVASSRLSHNLRANLRDTMLTMHDDPAARHQLASGSIQRFVPIDDGSYNDIREMRRVIEASGLVGLGEPTPAYSF